MDRINGRRKPRPQIYNPRSRYIVLGCIPIPGFYIDFFSGFHDAVAVGFGDIGTRMNIHKEVSGFQTVG